MNQKLVDEMNDVITLIGIERKLGRMTITPEEVEFIKELSDKRRLPRAEYVLSRLYLYGRGVAQDRALAMKYLAISSRHASYDLQLKIAYTYHVMGEYKKITRCLERALEDCKLI